MAYYELTEEQAQAAIDMINNFPPTLIKPGLDNIQNFVVMARNITDALQKPIQKLAIASPNIDNKEDKK